MGLHIHVLGQRAKIFDDYGIIIDQWQRMKKREREQVKKEKEQWRRKKPELERETNKKKEREINS